MKTKIIILVNALVLMGSAGFAIASVADLEKPAANLTERWTVGSDGWTNYIVGQADALSGWTNASLYAKYLGRVQGLADPQKVLLSATADSSGGCFAGDYSRIEAVSFDVQIQNDVAVTFYFKSATGVTWRKKITSLPSTMGPNEWTNVVVQLVNDGAWSPYCEGAATADFAADKRAVLELGVRTDRNEQTGNGNEQNFYVDNLKLVGPWGMPLTNGVPLAWLMENGLAAEQARIDTDGDGFSNIAEFLAGTDPNSSSSYFRIEIGRNDSGRTVVKWKDNKYVLFDLLATTDLTQEFKPVAGATGIQGFGTQQEVQVDGEGAGACFYKVQIRQAP